MIHLARSLPYQPPYAWTPLLAFLAARAIPGVEAVSGASYRRVFEIDGAWGHLEVRHHAGRKQLDLDVWLPREREMPGAAVERVEQVFDLAADPRVVAEHFEADGLLGPRVRRLPGLRVPGAWDIFELGVRAILGQQVTVKGASTLAGRLVSLCGRPVPIDVPGLSHVFPRPGDLAAANLSALGVPARRRESLRAFAEACSSGTVSAERADLDQVLIALPGFGDWTVQYVLMRACSEPDAFPASDLWLRRAAGEASVKALVRRAEAWRPFRAYAALYLVAGAGRMTLTELVSRLVAIDSVNPALVPGAAGERAIAAFVATWLRTRGVSVIEVASGPLGAERPSLLGHVRGTGSGPALMLYAHVDTVGAGDMTDPFTPLVRGSALHGRGAYDMKGSLAAIMRVAAAAAEQPAAGDLWVMIAADEESDSHGAGALLAELARRGARPDACIVTEPSDLRLMLGHRGFATGTIVTRGRAAHTARRDDGVDAIAMMARVVVALEDLDARLQAEPAHPRLGHSAVVASLVDGGSELFTYPARCDAKFVWRTVPGQTPDVLTAEIERIFEALRARDSRFDATLSWHLWRDPMIVAEDAPVARAIADASRHVTGRSPETCAAPWWTDAALIQAAGVPVAIFGPSGGGIHAADEWVDLDSLAQLERILLHLARER